MISSTLKNRSHSKIFTPDHIAGIQKASRLRRETSPLRSTEICIGKGGAERGESLTSGFKIKTFLAAINSDYLWAVYKQKELPEADFLVRRLESKLERDLSEIKTEISTFLSEYFYNLGLIEKCYPYPKDAHLTHENYGQRFEKLESLKKDGFKKLSEILGAGEKANHDDDNRL